MTIAKTESFLKGLFKGKPSCPGMFVAVERGSREVVGFIHGGAIRKAIAGHRGEIYAFYVSPRRSGRGIGKKLFARMTSWFRAEGFASFALWVLRDNPSCGVYEALSGNPCGEDKARIGKRLYPVVAYAWKTPEGGPA
jgi:GNAT superfamily N-acetyltransferase